MTQKEMTVNAIKIVRKNVDVRTFLAPALTGMVPVGLVPSKKVKQEMMDEAAASATLTVPKPVMSEEAAAVAAVVRQVASVMIEEGPREIKEFITYKDGRFEEITTPYCPGIQKILASVFPGLHLKPLALSSATMDTEDDIDIGTPVIPVDKEMTAKEKEGSAKAAEEPGKKLHRKKMERCHLRVKFPTKKEKEAMSSKEKEKLTKEKSTKLKELSESKSKHCRMVM